MNSKEHIMGVKKGLHEAILRIDELDMSADDFDRDEFMAIMINNFDIIMAHLKMAVQYPGEIP